MWVTSPASWRFDRTRVGFAARILISVVASIALSCSGAGSAGSPGDAPLDTEDGAGGAELGAINDSSTTDAQQPAGDDAPPADSVAVFDPALAPACPPGKPDAAPVVIGSGDAKSDPRAAALLPNGHVALLVEELDTSGHSIFRYMEVSVAGTVVKEIPNILGESLGYWPVDAAIRIRDNAVYAAANDRNYAWIWQLDLLTGKTLTDKFLKSGDLGGQPVQLAFDGKVISACSFQHFKAFRSAVLEDLPLSPTDNPVKQKVKWDSPDGSGDFVSDVAIGANGTDRYIVSEGPAELDNCVKLSAYMEKCSFAIRALKVTPDATAAQDILVTELELPKEGEGRKRRLIAHNDKAWWFYRKQVSTAPIKFVMMFRHLHIDNGAVKVGDEQASLPPSEGYPDLDRTLLAQEGAAGHLFLGSIMPSKTPQVYSLDNLSAVPFAYAAPEGLARMPVAVLRVPQGWLAVHGNTWQNRTALLRLPCR